MSEQTAEAIPKGKVGHRWVLTLPLLLACAGVMAWAQYRYLAYPIRYTRRDFMSLWGGGRALLEGADPYDPAEWLPLRAKYGSTWVPDERALLLVPLVLLFARARSGRLRWSLWGALAIALPWVLYWAATRSDSDVLSALAPALAGVAFLAATEARRSALAAIAEAAPDTVGAG